jgi:group I intron endonuclease
MLITLFILIQTSILKEIAPCESVSLLNGLGNKPLSIGAYILNKMNYNISEKNRSGIYVIVNLIDKRIYVGSSKNLHKRYLHHKEDLFKKCHKNKHLQNFHNKYGIQTLSFKLLEYCETDKLLEREQYYLDKLKPFKKNGFNIFKKSFGGFEKHSEKSKLKMSLQRRGVKRGVYSEKHRKSISDGIKNSIKCKIHLNKMQQGCAKTYFFKNQEGEIIKIINLRKFCIENGLSDTKMVQVYKGTRVSHKGWKKNRGRKEKIPPHFKTIYKYTLDKKFVVKFTSLLKAANSVNSTNTKAISNCAKMNKKNYRGFIWRFKRIKKIKK